MRSQQEIEDAAIEAANDAEDRRTGGTFAAKYLGPLDGWDGKTMPSPAAAQGPTRIWNDEVAPDTRPQAGGEQHMAPDHNLFHCPHPDCRRSAWSAGAPVGPPAELLDPTTAPYAGDAS